MGWVGLRKNENTFMCVWDGRREAEICESREEQERWMCVKNGS
jgi:hypothetical protein